MIPYHSRDLTPEPIKQKEVIWRQQWDWIQLTAYNWYLFVVRLQHESGQWSEPPRKLPASSTASRKGLRNCLLHVGHWNRGPGAQLRVQRQRSVQLGEARLDLCQNHPQGVYQQKLWKRTVVQLEFSSGKMSLLDIFTGKIFLLWAQVLMLTMWIGWNMGNVK